MIGNVRNVSARWTRFHSAKRRLNVYLLPRHIVLRTRESQEEVDKLWEKLSEGGEKQRCGWLKDKYGISWQIIPNALGQMLQDKDAEKSKRVMNAMLQMDKLDIKTLKQAYDRQ